MTDPLRAAAHLLVNKFHGNFMIDPNSEFAMLIGDLQAALLQTKNSFICPTCSNLKDAPQHVMGCETGRREAITAVVDATESPAYQRGWAESRNATLDEVVRAVERHAPRVSDFGVMTCAAADFSGDMAFEAHVLARIEKLRKEGAE